MAARARPALTPEARRNARRIGVKEAHRALVQAGVRDEVELWCDGGMKTGLDVVKMILLGANRCGFGTLTMVSIGCTVLSRLPVGHVPRRDCHAD